MTMPMTNEMLRRAMPALARPALAAAILALAGAAPARAADPVGIWQTQDGRGRVRTERCGPGKADLCGYVVWTKEPLEDGRPRLDAANPDPKRKARAVLGHEMMIALKPADGHDGGSYKGKIYNADNGKLYDVEVWSEEAAELSVKGCLFSYLCMTQGWKRVADVLPGQLQGPTDAAGGPRSDR